MDLSNQSTDYLIKTYCHLVNNVLPQNSENMQDFPPAEMWKGVRNEIDKAIEAVSSELSKRNIDAGTIDCSLIKI